MSELIRRQDAIKAIEDLPNCYNGFSDTYDKACIIGTLEEVPSAQQWIPCKERLPEEDYCTGSGVQYSDDVLITVVNTMDEETIIDYGHTTDGEWYSETTDCFIPHGWKPIAWMPLPKPYEGETE